ncbi:porin [Scleromatobacter humisilvae]|uniref:Porin n=1 Tax=Scleromatobacter humisilvae TaxID=2897159 RepID=A0A9X1YJ30_9BURK|nr:porin [Scleromatobacter humisilvae]MCK9685327.1 porin [Scleromatobacter humisilvae]
MKNFAMRASALAVLALAQPVFASEVDDLRAEIAAQKAAEAAQKARLDALEQRLNAMTAQQAAAPAPAKAAPIPVAMTTDQNGVKLVDAPSGVSLYNNGTTSLHMYGLIEATGSHANHQTTGGGSTTGFQVAWFSGNRLGFDADHALAIGDQIGLPGLKVISKLETEFELPTGDMDTSDVFFNRDAWMGFYSDDLGKLTFGRQNTLTRDFTQTWGDAYGTADVTLKEGGYSNVNNFKQFIFYSGSANGTRMNSSIAWKKKFGAHVVTGLAYAFGSQGAGGSGDVGNGGSTPGDFKKGSTQEASIALNSIDIGGGLLSANLSYDRANVNDLIHQSELVGGDFRIGMFRVNAGYVHYTAEQGANNSAGTRTDNAWTISASLLPTPENEFALGFNDSKGKHAGFNGGGNILNPFGNTAGVTAVAANGSKKALFASYMYHVDRQLDVYLAGDYFKVDGAWVLGDAQGNGNHFGAGQAYSNETEIAIGARYKF